MLLNQGIFRKFDEELSLGNHVLVGLHYQRAPTTLKIELISITFERLKFCYVTDSNFIFNLQVYIRKITISLTKNFVWISVSYLQN